MPVAEFEFVRPSRTHKFVNPLVLPYLANVFILVPVGFGALLNLWPVAGSHFPESVGWRTLVGSLWTAILVGSLLGLFQPVRFSPLLLLQVFYKSLWLAVYVLPRALDLSRRGEVPWGIAGTFLLSVAFYPWVIPWAYLSCAPRP